MVRILMRIKELLKPKRGGRLLQSAAVEDSPWGAPHDNDFLGSVGRESASWQPILSTLQRDPLAVHLFVRFTSVTETRLDAVVPIMGGMILVSVSRSGDQYAIGLIGRNAEARRWLNDMFVTKSRLFMPRDGRVFHVLAIVNGAKKGWS
jgi:hypothetical protein